MPSSSTLRQPSRTYPLAPYRTDQTLVLDMVLLRSRVEFYVDIGSGRPPMPVRFAVDSGASCSVMSLEMAHANGVPVPPPEAEIDLPLSTAHGTTSARVRPGRVRLWWDRTGGGYPFDWPMLFRVGGPLGLPSVLGLGGVLKTCRWTLDGAYSPAAPHGALTLDDVR